jgi:hypothetical protein
MRYIIPAFLVLALCGCGEKVRIYSGNCDIVDAKITAEGVDGLPEDWQIVLLEWQSSRHATGIPKAKEVGALVIKFRNASNMEERKEIARALVAAVKELKD